MTRGVNSKVREELLSAVDRQLLRCGESTVTVIKTFFKQERLCITGGDD